MQLMSWTPLSKLVTCKAKWKKNPTANFLMIWRLQDIFAPKLYNPNLTQIGMSY